MDLGQKNLTRVGLGQCFVTCVWSGQPSMVWVWRITPKNAKCFNFLPFRSKIISLGRVKKYPGQRLVSLLFTEGQKYASVGRRDISIVLWSEAFGMREKVKTQWWPSQSRKVSILKCLSIERQERLWSESGPMRVSN